MSNLYGNVVLTVIAVALVVIAAQGMVQPSNASIDILQRVQICDDTGRCAKIDPTFDALTVKDPL